MRIPLQPQSVPDRILPPHNLQRQRAAHAAEDEERPLPPERIDDDAEDEPVDQLGVGEEVEGSGRGTTLEELGHVDPPFHPLWSRPRERIDEEHEKEARVDANVVLVILRFSFLSSGTGAETLLEREYLLCDISGNEDNRFILTLPTAPIPLMYVQLLARGVSDQYFHQRKRRILLRDDAYRRWIHAQVERL